MTGHAHKSRVSALEVTPTGAESGVGALEFFI